MNFPFWINTVQFLFLYRVTEWMSDWLLTQSVYLISLSHLCTKSTKWSLAPIQSKILLKAILLEFSPSMIIIYSITIHWRRCLKCISTWSYILFGENIRFNLCMCVFVSLTVCISIVSCSIIDIGIEGVKRPSRRAGMSVANVGASND